MLKFTRNFSREVVISGASRTPIGSFRKSLKSVSATKLGSIAIENAIKHSKITKDAIQEVYMGQVMQGFCGQAPARQAVLFAGLPQSVVCTTINKVCASGMKTMMLAAQSIRHSYQDVIIAGGMESMSNGPFYLSRNEPKYGGDKVFDSVVFDGLTDVYDQIHMGNIGEMTAKEHSITREMQDNYACRSYERAQKALSDGIFSKEIGHVTLKDRKGEVVISNDEEFSKVDLNKILALKTVFQKENGTITAGNASGLADGAAATVITAKEYADKNGLNQIAKIIGFCDAECKPTDFPVAPIVAVEKLLKMHSLKASDIDLWEVNEAFSVVPLVFMKKLNISHDRMNVHGGAVSIGHPLGMSGTRISMHLALNLEKGQKGIAAICNGGGGASAILIEGL